MTWIMKFVGSKTVITVAAALVAILTLLGMIQYIRSVEIDRMVKDIQIEQLQNEIEMRKEVDEILQENRNANPTRNGSIALDLLRNRYGTDSN